MSIMTGDGSYENATTDHVCRVPILPNQVEEWLQDLRCTSTGRKCDGYGIWGGGGGGGGSAAGAGGTAAARHTYQQRPRPQHARNALAQYRANPTLTGLGTFCVYPASALDAHEKYHFEWFWCRTARKLQGAFFSDAGNTVLFQASATERAVTHAVLALCSVHRGADMPVLLQHEESFALVQYNKAIRYLQPRLMASDRSSLRLSLLSCIAFVHLEFFRSHYRAAQSHLEHGLRMLDYLQALSSSNSGEAGGSKQSSSFIDEWILRNFRGLYLQSTLFGQQPRRPWVAVDGLKHISATATFSSAHQARDYLENLLLKICQMAETYSMQSSNWSERARSGPTQQPPAEIERGLKSWKLACDETLAVFKSSMNGLEAFAYRLLYVYHTMAEVMVDTMCQTMESRFDRHTPRFVSMIEQTLQLRHIALTSKVRQRYFGSEEGLSHSIAGMGLMAPLFYLALKCRVHCLRLQAIRLIEEIPRKEGIWDATLVAQIARKVMTIEEISMCTSDVSDDDFLFTDVPGEQVQPLPVPPASERVEAIEVLLPDGPWDPVILKCSYQHNTKCDTYLIERNEAITTKS